MSMFCTVEVTWQTKLNIIVTTNLLSLLSGVPDGLQRKQLSIFQVSFLSYSVQIATRGRDTEINKSCQSFLSVCTQRLTLCKKASNHHANLPLEMYNFTL